VESGDGCPALPPSPNSMNCIERRRCVGCGSSLIFNENTLGPLVCPEETVRSHHANARFHVASVKNDEKMIL